MWPHFVHMFPWKFIRGNRSTSVTTPFVLTPAGSWQLFFRHTWSMYMFYIVFQNLTSPENPCTATNRVFKGFLENKVLDSSPWFGVFCRLIFPRVFFSGGVFFPTHRCHAVFVLHATVLPSFRLAVFTNFHCKRSWLLGESQDLHNLPQLGSSGMWCLRTCGLNIIFHRPSKLRVWGHHT